MRTHSDRVSFIWSIADLIRDHFKRGKYQDVILPFTVLRRIDCVLAPTKEAVLERNAKLKGRLENLDPQLRNASGYAFYNTSVYDFPKLLDDAPALAANLRNYINGFSPNMREVIERFDFDNTIDKLDDAGLLFQVMERFSQVDLGPETVSNHEMGTIFEELIRRFNEALNENPGEHFTPREVIRLMTELLLYQDEDMLAENHIVRTVYDPCCGSGGMLTIAKDRIEEMNSQADVHLFGQEVNPETFAMCKSDLFIKDPSGHDADHIAFGSTLSDPKHVRDFDYCLANPPYGKDWKADQDAVEAEANRGHAGRFGAGTPRKSDGQMLFLQDMISHIKSPEDDGARIAIIMNGSPLFTGDAGSGESEIRRWIIENDWLEAIVALPEQLFYNTGIATYVWIVTNRKEPRRAGTVQLIDATEMWVPMRKSLGDKRRQISAEQITEIACLHDAFEENDRVQIFANEEFGYRKVRVERPLRLNFQASEERIQRLRDETKFQNLAKSRKKDEEERKAAEAEGREMQQAIIELLRGMGDELVTSRDEFEQRLKGAAEEAGVKLYARHRNMIVDALGEQDPEAEICRDSNGNPEYDTDLRDYEQVPLTEDVQEFFEREVAPHVPDAWIDEDYTDEKDDRVGRVGYEINFNRYFYTYDPPRPLEEIEADIKELETEIVRMLGEITQ